MAQTHSLDLESGSSQYASITDASQTGLDLSGDLTVEAWIRPESTPGASTYYPIASKFDTASNQRSWHFSYYLDGGSVSLGLFTSSAGTVTNQVSHAITLTNGVWYHVAATYTSGGSGSITLYVNGKAVQTGSPGDASLFNSSAPFAVGTRIIAGTPNDFFDGLIKDVRVFNDVRTQSEIVSDAHTENVSDANLQGEWNFNNAYTDSSGNGNTLTASGSPVFSTNIPWTAPADGANAQFIGNGVSWWTMDESSGTRADSIGSNDLADNNTVGSGTGKWDLAADLVAASSEYLSIADGSQTGLDFTGDFTMVAWIYPDSIATNARYFMMKGDTGGTWYGFFIDTDGTLYAQYDNGTSGDTVNSGSGVITAGSWFHVVAVRKGTTAYLYVNGVLKGTATVNSDSLATSDPFIMGGRWTSGAFNDRAFDGKLDESSVYSTALDYGNVLDLYAAGAGIPYAAAAAGGATPTPTLLTLGAG